MVQRESEVWSPAPWQLHIALREPHFENLFEMQIKKQTHLEINLTSI